MAGSFLLIISPFQEATDTSLSAYHLKFLFSNSTPKIKNVEILNINFSLHLDRKLYYSKKNVDRIIGNV